MGKRAVVRACGCDTKGPYRTNSDAIGRLKVSAPRPRATDYSVRAYRSLVDFQAATNRHLADSQRHPQSDQLDCRPR